MNLRVSLPALQTGSHCLGTGVGGEGVAQVKCADITRLHVLNEADLREGSGEFTLFAKKTNHAAISCL